MGLHLAPNLSNPPPPIIFQNPQVVYRVAAGQIEQNQGIDYLNIAPALFPLPEFHVTLDGLGQTCYMGQVEIGG